MADGQLKLFKGDKQTFNSINNSDYKKISEGNLIVAKENSSSGDLYIDYSDTERLQLASNKAIIGTNYNKQSNSNNYALFGSNLKGENNVLLEVDSTLNADSTHPVQNAPVANAISSHTTSIGELNSWKTSASSAISTLQTDVDNVEKDISTRINPILSGLNNTIRTTAADEINTLIDAADNPDTIEDINSLVKYVNDNAGDIAALIDEVNGKAEVELISQSEYDSRLAAGTLDPTIVYFINDADGYIDETVNIVDLKNRIIVLENSKAAASDVVNLDNRVTVLENNKVTAANQITYSNTSSGLAATNIQSAIDELSTKTQSSYSASFIAEYNVTPFSEIRNAISEGKDVAVRYNCNVGGINGVVYGELESYNSATATFSAIAYDTSYEFFCDVASGWFINIKPEKTKLSEFTNDANYAKYKYFNFVEIGVDVEGNPTYDEIKEAILSDVTPVLIHGHYIAHMTSGHWGSEAFEQEKLPEFTFVTHRSDMNNHWKIKYTEFWCTKQDDGSTLWVVGEHYYIEDFVAEYGETSYTELLQAYKNGKELILHIPYGTVSKTQPRMYARLHRLDGNGDSRNFVFVCTEHGKDHHFLLGYVNDWTYWCYDQESRFEGIDNSISSLYNSISSLNNNIGSIRGGFVNNAGTLHITHPGIYLIIQGGTSNKKIIINQPEGKVLEETWNGIILMAYEGGVITPIGIEASLTIAGAFKTPGTFQGWTTDGSYSTTINYPAKCVIAYLGNSNVNYLA